MYRCVYMSVVYTCACSDRGENTHRQNKEQDRIYTWAEYTGKAGESTDRGKAERTDVGRIHRTSRTLMSSFSLVLVLLSK